MTQKTRNLSPPGPEAAPAACYCTRLEGCLRSAATLRRRDVALGLLRLFWAAVLCILLWYIFGRHALAWPWLLLPCIGFGMAARLHAHVLAASDRTRRAVSWYELGLARLEDRWSGLQPRATPAAAADSLYAADLDLFGPGSLFELLCTTRTNLGETTLANWLLQPAPGPTIKARQAAVGELRDRLDLRESMAGVRGPTPFLLDAEVLAAWGEGFRGDASGADAPGGDSHTPAIPSIFRWLAPALAFLSILAAIWWALGHTAALFSLVLLVNGSVTYLLGARLKPLLQTTEQAAGPLGLLAELFAILERETFQSPLLQSTQNVFRVDGALASNAVRRFARLAGAAEQRANMIARLLDFCLLYSVHVGLLVERWRARHGEELRPWFRALGEAEALLALSAYHFEHPEDPFPEIGTDAAFEAQALGHPLLPRAGCVRNDVALDAEKQLLIISGSNMSGKSTLLRATGVACVMAGAGAPVRALRLRLGPLRVAASIQVADSLQGGRSRFYAEILRLRSICALARTEPPVLFLLDELLAGTNSHDRLAGATGVVKSLLEAGALGMLSTHDLALTQLGPELQRVVRNAHFEDRIEAGGLRFDYTLREGIITRSNGVELMRLIGLKV